MGVSMLVRYLLQVTTVSRPHVGQGRLLLRVILSLPLCLCVLLPNSLSLLKQVSTHQSERMRRNVWCVDRRHELADGRLYLSSGLPFSVLLIANSLLLCPLRSEEHTSELQSQR